MLVSSDAFGDAVREVYEPEWPGSDKVIQYLEVCYQKVAIIPGLNVRNVWVSADCLFGQSL